MGDLISRSAALGHGKGVKHGYYYEPWYSSYKSMMERCYLPTAGNFGRYGKKGVAVCEEWHDINNFAKWVAISGFKPGLTIDRIDGTKGYSPTNCRWATKKQQSNNRKNTFFCTYKGKTKALTERDVGIDVDKYELIMALAYDRGQYDKGYADGRRAAMSEIVRCRDCKYYKEGELLAPEKFCFRLMHPTENRRIGYNFADDDFCSYGERKDNE